MFDLGRIVGFDWDDRNAPKSEGKDGISQAEAEQVFLSTPLLLLDDPSHSTFERRYHALGNTKAGKHLQVSFTLRRNDTLLRIISAPSMSARERVRYAEET